MSGGADVDVAVIGGGLAGTAVLRDLARRGASVVLFERGDLVSGGSIAGLGTIDTRDLDLEHARDAPARAARVAREREAGVLMRTAPHLASLVPVIALDASERRGPRLLARWDAILALRSRAGEPIDRRALDARAARTREPALALDDDRGAILTSRLRLDASRLGLAFARDAAEQGAELRLREEVVSVSVEGVVVRVASRHVETGATSELRARAVVVATGAWPTLGARVPRPRERRVHLVIEQALTTHAVVTSDASVVPFHNVTLVSGLASAFDGAADATRVTRDEVRALLARLAPLLPDLREARVNAAYASVRRSIAARDATEPPIYGVPVGSPWDARVRAEDVGARVAKLLGLTTPGGTDVAKVPGGEEVVDSFVVAERMAIPEPTARRVALRHGARSIDIGARIGKRRTEAAVVCACEPVLEAEVRHAVRMEHARDVSDVGRRTCLGHGACGGMRCAHRAAEIVVAERALAPHEAHEMARRFLVERWRARAPALDPASLAQEELAHARWASASITSAPEPESAE